SIGVFALRDLDRQRTRAAGRNEVTAEVGRRGAGRRVLEQRGARREEESRQQFVPAELGEDVCHGLTVTARFLGTGTCVGPYASYCSFGGERNNELLTSGADPERLRPDIVRVESEHGGKALA